MNINYIFGASLVWLVCAYFVYQDAIKRGLRKDAAVWAIVSFLFGLLGLAAYWYMVIRTDKHQS